MADLILEKATELTEGCERIEECLLLAAVGGEAVKAVERWLAESYQKEGETVRRVTLPGSFVSRHFFLLDRRMPEREIIEGLAGCGLIAEARTLGRLAAVYVPPQHVARGRRALFN